MQAKDEKYVSSSDELHIAARSNALPKYEDCQVSMAVLYQGHTLILKPLFPEILLKGLKKSLKNRRQTDEDFYLHISYRNI